MSLKDQIEEAAHATHLTEWMVQLEIMAEEATTEAAEAEDKFKQIQEDTIRHLLEAKKDGSLLTELKQLKARYDDDPESTQETGMETLWDTLTVDIAGLHHSVDLSSKSKIDEYVGLLVDVLRVAHEEEVA